MARNIPNKTIEDLVAAFYQQLLLPVYLHFSSRLLHPYILLIGVTTIASIAGQLGDLVESAIKRHYEVKDSGSSAQAMVAFLATGLTVSFLFCRCFIFFIS